MNRRFAFFLIPAVLALMPKCLRAQECQVWLQEQPSSFALSIMEDAGAARKYPGLHRIRVKSTSLLGCDFYEEYSKDPLAMYDVTVLRDGKPVRETDAMKELRDGLRAEDLACPSRQHKAPLNTGDTWELPIDISDYYDMSRPGSYEITVSRAIWPCRSGQGQVRSNSLTVQAPTGVASRSIPTADRPAPSFELILTKEDEDEDDFQGRIKVDWKNTSQRPFFYDNCNESLHMYKFVVLRDGDPLEPNEEMRQIEQNQESVLCPNPENHAYFKLKPGESTSDSYAIRNYFDIEKPGSYTVYVTRETFPWNPAKSVTVESNPVSFIVSPAPPEPADTDSKDDDKQEEGTR